MARDEDNYNEERGGRGREPYVASQPSQPKKHSGQNIILTLVIIFMLIVGGLWGFYFFSSSTGQRFASDWFGKISNPIVSLYNTIVQRTQSAGTAFYTADVNATSVDYGVKFVRFESVGSKKIPSGSVASFKYVVTVGQNVENIPLTLQCKVDPQDVVDGEISKIPEGVIQLSSENPAKANNLRCSFKTKEIQEDKTVTVKGSMSAMIPTQRASLKVYLLGQKEYEALGGKDFFKVNNKPDRLPIKALYNGEPVEVGIGVSEDYSQPVIVGDEYHPMVGIGLTNRWDGKVVEINSLLLFLPEGVSINKDSSPKSVLCPFSDSVQTPTGTKVNMYEADSALLKSVGSFGSGETDNYKRFECQLAIETSLVEGKKAGFQTAYHVDVGYVYIFNEKSDVVTLVKKSVAPPEKEGGNTT
jgi:hypothetical protein